jgi:hypothetical protein
MYKLIKNRDGITYTIFRIIDKASIPFEPANTDYQEYLKWLEEGNTPLPADNSPQENN